MYRKNFVRASALRIAALAAAVLAALASSPTAHAAPAYKVLYSFCVGGCGTGYLSPTNLLQDGTGNLYGITYDGGSGDSGVVFEQVKSGQEWSYQVLYNFCSKSGCADGGRPTGSLVIDADGNLYGTTSAGGAFGHGTAFELVTNAGAFDLVTLYDFCSQANCTDGREAPGALTYHGQESGTPYDGVSPLYGTTELGGAHGRGLAFQLTSVEGKKTRKLKAIYDFCALQNCTDGGRPKDLKIDGAGNLYGTTAEGGASGRGTVFKLSPKKKGFKESVLYSFCAKGNCVDGSIPNGGLAIDASGNLFGTTQSGGDFNTGAVFKLVPKRQDSKETVLHSFCAQDGCPDGREPKPELTIDANGNLFGTTRLGGAFAAGALFRVKGTKYKVLYDFCAEGGCPDGGSPYAGVIVDGAGNLFGTTVGGGGAGHGTVFELTP